MALTAKQSAVLDYLRGRREQGGSMPTLREMQAHFGFSSPFAVTRHLVALETKGFLSRSQGRARSLVLNHEAARPRWRSIPLLGAIPAGLPSDQQEESDRCISVDVDTLKLPIDGRTFALEVRGDSMIGAGILDRDVVILEMAEARNGNIVAALIDGETTLKRYLVQNGEPFLRAENPNYPDLIPAEELTIQGVFRALIRTNPN